MFVTLLYGTLNVTTRRFEYIRAGHDLPLALEADGGVLPLDKQPGQPLGLVLQPAFDEGALTLPQGGLLMMYTDGVTETTDSKGAMFGLGGLRAALKDCATVSAERVCDHVMTTLGRFRVGAPQGDDITVLAVRVS